MMAPLYAMAWVTVRSAVRSRLVACLLVALAVAAVAIPLTVGGDGTPLGDTAVPLAYGLNSAAFILAVATLWAACAAVAKDIEDRQIRLIAVKPVRAFTLWLGKWLGIVLLDALLLGASGAAVYGIVRARLAAPRWTDADRAHVRGELLVARRRITPIPVCLEHDVAARVARWKASGKAPADTPDDALADEVRRRLTGLRSTVAPGASRQWTFDVAGLRGCPPVSLRTRAVSPPADRGRVAGEWRLSAADGSDTRAVVPVTYTGAQTRRDALPPAFVAGALEDGRVAATFHNAARPGSTTAVFHPTGGVELFVGEGAFEPNLLRALAMRLAALAALAALGLAAGSLFSFPVAVFAATAAVLAMRLGIGFASSGGIPSCGHDHGHGGGTPHSRVERAGELVLSAIHRAAVPITDVQPVRRLTEGVRVTWADTGRATLWLALLWPALAGAASAWVLRRRELAAS